MNIRSRGISQRLLVCLIAVAVGLFFLGFWVFEARASLGETLVVDKGREVLKIHSNSPPQNEKASHEVRSNYLDSFDDLREFGTGEDNTESVALGDIDADGDLDIVVANAVEMNMAILNDGSGHFDMSEENLRYYGTGSDNTFSVALGDIDGDGDLDIVAGNYSDQNMIYWNNESNFNDSSAFGQGLGDVYTATRIVALGDVNGDGAFDIFAGDKQQDAIFLNDGYGNFYAGSYNCTTPPTGVICIGASYEDTTSAAFGDVDEDGDLDLVVGRGSAQSKVYVNNPLGTFNTTRNFGSAPGNIDSLVLGDINDDGHLDIVTGNFGQDYFFLNDGTGSFPSATVYGGDDWSYGIALGDINRDGYLDIVLANYLYANDIYYNDGSGLFPTGQPYGSGSDQTEAVALGDMDGDGDLDIVNGNNNQQNAVYINNLQVNFAHAQTFGDGSKPAYNIAIGDLDGDGDLDIVEGQGGAGADNLIYTNNGFFNFSAGVSFGPYNQSTQKIVLGDMDGDHDLDIVLGNAVANDRVYFNDGFGDFPSYQDFYTSTQTSTAGLAVGDVDSDGDLDILMGNYQKQNAILLNDGAGKFYYGPIHCDTPPDNVRCVGPGDDWTSAVALGDVDGDGDLDAVVGNQWWAGATEPNSAVFFNDGAGNFPISTGFGLFTANTDDIALGDLDGDGDLDLVTANYGQVDAYYLNDGGGHFDDRHTLPSGINRTYGLALGDIDNDGDLDILTSSAVLAEYNYIYTNNGRGEYALAYAFGEMTDQTRGLTVGDLDGDGDLDIVAGEWDEANKIYENRLNTAEGLLNASPVIYARRPTQTGDAFGYSAPEIIAAQNVEIPYWLFDPEGDILGHVEAYYSLNGGGAWQVADSFATLTTNLTTDYNSENPAFDWNDISGTNEWFLDDEDYYGPLDIGFEFPFYGNTYTQFWVHSNGALSFVDPGSPLTFINSCLPATAAPYPLILPFWDDLNPTEKYIWYEWFPEIGSPDHLVVEFMEVPRYGETDPNTFEVILHADGRIIFQYLDMQSSTLSSATIGIQGDGGRAFQIACDEPYVANDIAVQISPDSLHSYTWDLFESGFFGQSDNVVLRFEAIPQVDGTGSPGTYAYPNQAPALSLYPKASVTTFPFRARGTQVRVISGTVGVDGALVYRIPKGELYGSAIADNNGHPYTTDINGFLQGHGTVQPGDRLVAMLPITGTNTYSLYYTNVTPIPGGMDAHLVENPGVQELTVSPGNPLVLFDLDVSLQWDARNDHSYMAQLEYDLIRASELLFDWTDGQAALGEVRVFHNRENWNSAHIRIYSTNQQRPMALQGGVVTEVITDTDVSTVIYSPGQVHMGATWNRYGESGSSLGEDWPRALAHELGHYAFFLNDNYLGENAEGQVVPVDTCPGAMTDPYRQDDPYDEFHGNLLWLFRCEDTLSNLTTGRSDWATILTYYPDLIGKTGNIGPVLLPLRVTQIQEQIPITPCASLSDPTFYLVEGVERVQPDERARAFLFQDGWAIDLGRPTIDRVLARGAREGDRLCVYDPGEKRIGCETITAGDEQISMLTYSYRDPDILITPITSQTVRLIVGNLAPGLTLSATLYPLTGPALETIGLERIGLYYSGTFSVTVPVYEGYVQLYEGDSDPRPEAITDFAIGGNPARQRGMGARQRGMGARQRGMGAPVSSADGQVTLYTDDTLLGLDEFYVLQASTRTPGVPPWTTQVGQAYYLSGSAPESSLAGASINFSYLGDNVPAGEENFLKIYYREWESLAWQTLTTTLDTYYNVATAPVVGLGQYALLSSLEIPLSGAGWNLFSYPVQVTRPITEALLSISGIYTTVYEYDASDLLDPWKIYNILLPDELNELTHLEFGKGYWIQVSQAITVYLRGIGTAADLGPDGWIPQPPATLWGEVNLDQAWALPAGQELTAWVDGHLCGQTLTQQWAGETVYLIHVETADASRPGCGLPGRQVHLRLGDQWVASLPWDQDHVLHAPLNPIWRAFLPLVIP